MNTTRAYKSLPDWAPIAICFVTSISLTILLIYFSLGEIAQLTGVALLAALALSKTVRGFFLLLLEEIWMGLCGGAIIAAIALPFTHQIYL